MTRALANTQQTSNTLNPLKGHKLPSFDGSAAADFLQWKDQVVSLFDYLQWNDRERAEYLPIILTKRAKQVYKSLPRQTRQSFDDIMEALDAQFCILRKPLIIKRLYYQWIY